MPTEKRLLAALSDIEETLESLGDDVHDIVGPIEQGESDDSEVEQEDLEDNSNESEELYFLLAENEGDRYYIAASVERNYMVIVYPYYISSYLGSQLSNEQVKHVIGEEVDWEEISEEDEDSLRDQAAETIIGNTPIEDCWHGRFYLSAYASTEGVGYHTEEAENRFPLAFQTTKNIYPYTGLPDPGELYDRILATINMGKRGKRYVEASFYITEEEDGDELVMRTRF